MRQSAQEVGCGSSCRYAEGIGDKGRDSGGGFPRFSVLLVLVEELTTRAPDALDEALHAFAFSEWRPVVIDLRARMVPLSVHTQPGGVRRREGGRRKRGSWGGWDLHDSPYGVSIVAFAEDRRSGLEFRAQGGDGIWRASRLRGEVCRMRKG